MAYSFEEIKELKPMKYWAFPSGSSANQKKRLMTAFKEGYILTLKRDGALYRAMIGEDILLQSRTTSVKTGEFVEKQDRVPHIVKALSNFPKNTVLMGEICFPIDYEGKISSDVVSIMGCNPAKAIERQKTIPMVYYIFDILMWDGEPFYNKPYKKRIEFLTKVEKDYTFEGLEYAKPIYKDLESSVQSFLDLGWEGGVLMKESEVYSFDKRPAWTSIKIKQSTDTIDLVIMGVLPPSKEYTGKYPTSHQYWENLKTGELLEGNYYAKAGYLPVSSNYFFDRPGALKLGAYYGDNLLEVCQVANLTDALREEIKADPTAFIGKAVEVEAMMIDVEKKSLRHPKLIKIRQDKDAKDCLYTEIFR